MIVLGRIVVYIRRGVCLQFLVPSFKDGTFAKLRVRTLVYRHIFAVGGVSPKLLAVRVLEDDDWGGDDCEVIRHFRRSMFVVLATTRENEYAWSVHILDPILRRIHTVVEGHDTHFDVVQTGATAEHFSATIVSECDVR